jgi:hypothetical protein
MGGDASLRYTAPASLAALDQEKWLVIKLRAASCCCCAAVIASDHQSAIWLQLQAALNLAACRSRICMRESKPRRTMTLSGGEPGVKRS